MRRSEELFRAARQVLVGGVNSPVRAFHAVGGIPVFFERAKGARLVDVDGRVLIDYVGSWGPMILGHSHPRVTAAAARALRDGASFGAPTIGETRLALLVRSAFPSVELVRFTNSGTEACMTALRLARGVTGKKRIIKFAGAYHGHGDSLLVAAGSGALSFGNPDSAGVPEELARLTSVLPYNDAQALARAFSKWDDIAAVIFEPVAGNMGVVAPTSAFLQALIKIPLRHGALLIADEVMTGFRLGWGGAQALLDFDADITCFGKILGGGFPVGGLGGSRQIMEKLSPEGPVYQAGTLSGNPVAMAAGEAALKELKRKPPYAKLRGLTNALVRGLKALAKRHGHAVTVNAVESMFTIFFTEGPVTDLASARRSDTKKYGRFFHEMLHREIYLPPAQFEAAFVSAAHRPADIERTLRVADAAFRHL